MRRTTRYVTPTGTARCDLGDGRNVEVPVVQGILKHAAEEELAALLEDPAVVLKYTLEALRVAPWQVLRRFPRWWLLECLPKARLREGRARALEFMLSGGQA